ncbi:hypothetical protein [Virgifigura deserti]|uniref:hypothetical protein n=1 Tax=Virgifigura deserti TaxID=2268457 RepID=UPI003CCBC06C
MVARVKTVAFQGIEVLEVDVQVQVAAGVPAFTLVGLPDKAVGVLKLLHSATGTPWPTFTFERTPRD